MATTSGHQARTLFMRTQAVANLLSPLAHSSNRHGMNRILIRQVSVSSSQLSESSPSPLSHYPSPDKHDNRLIQARFDTAERNGFRRKGDRNPGGRTHDNSKEWSRKGRATNSSNSNNANNRTQPKMFFPASPNPELHPTLYRVFFRSLDNIRTLEEAQVFIGHIKATYGPLLQYQFSRCPETKRYLGYGFMTFQDKSAMENLLRDGYLKVLQKDFEFKRCGMVDKPVLRFNPSGFSGFRTTSEATSPPVQSPSSTLASSTTTSTTTTSTTASCEEDEPSSVTSTSTTPDELSTPKAASMDHNDGVASSAAASEFEVPPSSPSSSSVSPPSEPSPPTQPGATEEAYPPQSFPPKQRVQLWKTATQQRPLEE